MPKRLLLLTLALLAVVLSACNPTPPPAPVLISPTFIQGQYAYIGYGERLKVLDITAPAQPVVLAEIGEAKKLIAQVQVMGDQLYTTSWDYQSQLDFLIYDLSDPKQPKLIGAYPLGTLYASRFVVDGRYAYVIVAPEIVVLDIGNPANPMEVGRVNVQVGQQFVKLGDTLYAAYGVCGSRSICRSRFTAIDVSDPAQPSVVVEHDPQMRFYFTTLAHFTAQKELYLGVSEDTGQSFGNSLKVFDWQETAAPKLVRTYPAPGFARAVTDDRVLLTHPDGSRVLVAWFMSDGTLDVRREAQLPERSFLSDVAIDGDYAYLALTRGTDEPFVQENELMVIDLQ